MLYLPPLRRLLVPSLICLAFVLAYRSSHRINNSYISSFLRERPTIYYPEEIVSVADLNSRFLIAQNPDEVYATPPQHLYYDFVNGEPDDQSFQLDNETDNGPKYVAPSANRYLKPLFECKTAPNKFTQHIRLKSYIRPISMTVTGETENEKRTFFNAAPMSLPYWSENQYLLVTRVRTDGATNINIICEANICHTDEREKRTKSKPCTEEDLSLLGGSPGMRCATPPLTLNVPPTPAKKCGKQMRALMDIPGFHDPRIFWSGKGEPLMMMNTQSQYACFGLWVIDLRQVHTPLNKLLGANPNLPTLGPLMSYPHMTEITRNPPEDRGPIEKNWMFFASSSSNYVHYDLGPTVRTFAQVLGGGLTTYNLTDPYELPCIQDGAKPKAYEVWGGSWHQGTNSLRLILCDRNDHSCKQRPENTVFWSLIHHKHKNYFSLPLRYERYFVVWSSTPPFHMLAMSSHPILMANETASGWELDETWDDDPEHHEMKKQGGKGKKEFAVFSYTPSIAYAWGRADDKPHDKNVGYLDDEVILGIGLDDEKHGYAVAKVSDLLQCMRACPGRSTEKLTKPKSGPKKKISSFFEADEKDREIILKGFAEGKTFEDIVAEGLVKYDFKEELKDAELMAVLEAEMLEAASDKGIKIPAPRLGKEGKAKPKETHEAMHEIPDAREAAAAGQEKKLGKSDTHPADNAAKKTKDLKKDEQRKGEEQKTTEVERKKGPKEQKQGEKSEKHNTEEQKHEGEAHDSHRGNPPK